jgi:hypothetical protein
MNKETIIYQTSPRVLLATNTFINVPVILKYEDTNLIEIIRETSLGYTTQIPIYHSDGTYLAKATGNRLYLTDDGKKVGLTIDKYKTVWVCKMAEKTLFEIHHQADDAFKTVAELYTPDGYFIKYANDPLPIVIDNNGSALRIGGVIMSGNTFVNNKIGIWIRKNGQLLIGVNQ